MTEKVVEQIAKEMPDMKETKLKMTNLQLYANGVFSNVYKGTLVSPNGPRDIAIKKTWPASHDRNFELVFLTGQGREKHKNVIHMLYAFSNRTKDGKVCEAFVFEFFPDTLHSLIKKQVLDMTDIKLYTWQLFNGLKYLASECIAHRDLKPVNTLVDHQSGLLRIGDFGSAKIMSDPLKRSTAYQVTRFYRPPELLLCDKIVDAQIYSPTVDVWSAGCIVGEMLRGKVLFAGRDSRHQLKEIFAALGTPSPQDIHCMLAPIKLQGEQAQGLGLAAFLPQNTPADAIQFVEKILVYKPKERLAGKECLRHPWFDSILAEGAKRSNGDPISNNITASDIKESQIDVKRGGVKLQALMGKRMDFLVRQHHDRKGSSSDSEENIVRRRKSDENRKTMRSMVDKVPERVPTEKQPADKKSSKESVLVTLKKNLPEKTGVEKKSSKESVIGTLRKQPSEMNAEQRVRKTKKSRTSH